MQTRTMVRWNNQWVLPSTSTGGAAMASAFILLVTIKHPEKRDALVFAGTNLTSHMLDWLHDGYGVDELTVAPRNSPGELFLMNFGPKIP